MRNAVFQSYNEFRRIAITSHHEDVREIRLVGLLFMRPEQHITNNEILPSLEYFDERSGKDIDFILPGWTKFDFRGTSWFFQANKFIKCCDVIASETKWKYSGGIDLLLFTTRRVPTQGPVLQQIYDVDFGGCVNIPLHELIQKNLVEGVDVLFERIFSFARAYRGTDPIQGISLQEARVSAIKGFVDSILGYLLPREARARLDYAKHFAMQDISKPNSLKSLRIKQTTSRRSENAYWEAKKTSQFQSKPILIPF